MSVKEGIILLHLFMIKSEINISTPSFFAIKGNQFIRFIKVGFSLHVIACLGVWLFISSVQELIVYRDVIIDLRFYVWLFFAWIGFVLPFFSEMDAYGRYQNYKLIKDKLYVLGFDGRLVRPFMYSNCQRFAILIAAIDLNYATEVKDYFLKNGYNWYHILPDTWLKKPLILFEKDFWKRILFTKYYKLQNFYW